MDKLIFMVDFIGTLEPATWVNDKGMKSWLWGVLLFLGFIFMRDGIKRGLLTLIRYGLTVLTVAFAVFSLL